MKLLKLTKWYFNNGRLYTNDLAQKSFLTTALCRKNWNCFGVWVKYVSEILVCFCQIKWLFWSFGRLAQISLGMFNIHIFILYQWNDSFLIGSSFRKVLENSILIKLVFFVLKKFILFLLIINLIVNNHIYPILKPFWGYKYASNSLLSI